MINSDQVTSLSPWVDDEGILLARVAVRRRGLTDGMFSHEQSMKTKDTSSLPISHVFCFWGGSEKPGQMLLWEMFQ